MARVIAHLLTADIAGIEVIHLSDLYITHRDVVQVARRLAERPGPLPPAPSAAPENVLVSRVLPQLGISLGGTARFEAVIAQMLQGAS